MAEKGHPLPKFGEWDVNDPASAEGYTVIFNKARNEKRSGGNTNSPPKGATLHISMEQLLESLNQKNGSAVYSLLLQNHDLSFASTRGIGECLI